MKVAQINVTCGAGSTGKICVEVSKLLHNNNIENYILYSSGKSDYTYGIKYTNESYIKFQALLTRLNGRYGFNSKKATKVLIRELEKIQPDVIHLHNLHGHNCNLEMLFEYVREYSIKVYWTFHDCWAFTGYCPHFIMANCNGWTNNCTNCNEYKRFSWIFNRSAELLQKKKTIFDGIDLTIITPSKWLSNIVKQSFLKSFEVRVINNGIDLGVFNPRCSSFKTSVGIPNDKKIILGVAFDWGKRKGLDIFINLANELNDNRYQIVLVGINENIKKQLPNNIITIKRTNNQRELANIYASADVFVNPTREDTFPTVNIEALACGTPVVTFNTGGSPEILDETCGCVVNIDDYESLKKEIINICENKGFLKEDCVQRARLFNQDEKYLEYYKLYNELI